MGENVGDRRETFMKTPNISIIMPLYNAGRYLRETLDSVKMQTFTDYELICVNDHSDDDTQEILDLYKNKDSRIKCFMNQERRGAAYSRNMGMNRAVGDYIIFLDGDDIFDEIMLEMAYETIVSKDADMVYFDFMPFKSEKIPIKAKVSHDERFKKAYCCNCFCLTDMKLCDFTYFNTAPWNKLYRTEFIRENRIMFQDLPCCNDVYFVLMSFFLAKKMIVLDIDRVMAYYRKHDETTKIGNNENPMCLFYALDQVRQELVERDLFHLYYEYFYVESFWTLFSIYKTTKNISQKKEFYTFIREEGIKKFRKNQEEYFSRISPYMQSQWNQWMNYESENLWTETNSPYLFKLYCYEKEIKELLENLECNNRKTALWGVGECGTALKIFCDENEIKIDVLLDINDEKQGKVIGGTKVKSPQYGLEGVEIIIVTGKGIYDDVVNLTQKKRVLEIIDFRNTIGI